MPTDPSSQALETPQLLAAIIDTSTDAIIGVTSEGIVTSWNRAAEKTFFFSAAEMIGGPISRIIPSERLREQREILNRVRHNERVEGVETMFRRKDGTNVDISITVLPIHDSHEDVIGASCVIRDITERRLLDAAVREQGQLETELRLETVFEHMNHGLVLSDLDGQILHWNPAALEMHGFKSGWNWRRHLQEFVELFELRTPEGEIVPFEDWPLNRVKRGLRVHAIDVRIRRRDTDWERVFSYSGDLVRERNGHQIAFLTITDVTRRTEAEDRLRESLQRIRDLHAALDEHAIVAVTDAYGRITDVNEKFCAISKYAREELIGQDHRLINSAYHSSEYIRDLWQTIRSGKVWKGEMRNRAKDGSFYWVDTTIVPFLGADGKPDHFIAVRADVTEHKRVEEELRKSNQLNRDVLDSMLAHIAVLDGEGTITMSNEVWQQFAAANSELPNAEILRAAKVGANYLEICDRAAQQCPEAAQAARGIRDVLAGKSSRFYSEYVCQSPGDDHWFALSVTPLLRSHGGGAVVAHVDITARRQAQVTIEQQAALLDHAREAILLRDLNGKLLFWSKGAERIYEWTREEVVGKDIARLLYKNEEDCRQGTTEVVETGEWTGELEQVTKSGRIIIVEARWTLLRDDKGAPNAVLAINLDITSRKKMEAQYLRAQRMESIGTLAGGVAHDLNNMLAPILMSVALLKGKLPDARDQELLNMLEEGASRGADLVRQILTFARGFETRQILVNPKHTIGEVSRILRDTLLQKITVQTEVVSDIWPLLGDPTQLHQVLLNLCVNARDAMPNGGTLTIRAENHMLDDNYAAMHLDAKAGPYVVISIIDTGVGIPADIREKIFDPFFTTKEVGKGTGLGLSTTSGIVKSHGGFINVYSEVGHGTTFSVYLPAQRGGAAATLSEQPERLPRGRGELILIADDEASVRNITTQTLEAFGYRAVTASDGAEALGVFAQHLAEVRAVITDMMMPYMDGPATIRAIRRLNSDVIIIAATGLGTDAQKQAAINAGADHFLQKPFSAETVLRVLNQALREPRGPVESHTT